MLYSLPSRDLFADFVEYMVNAHCADALVCISNCDKITPGMLMATMRLNVPTVFVSGAPMEAGKTKLSETKVDLTNVMVVAADPSVSDEDVVEMERSGCPTCGSCSGMFTANSMNCLTEALGLALPGKGTVVATHLEPKKLFLRAGRLAVDLCERYYKGGDESVRPRNVASFEAFENAMTVDIAMDGSTNTILHLLAAAQEAGVDFTMADLDRLSKKVPNISKVAPAVELYHVEDVHRSDGVVGIMAELDRGGLLNNQVRTVREPTLFDAIAKYDVVTNDDAALNEFYRAGPAGIATQEAFSQSERFDKLDLDRDRGCIRSVDSAYSRDGGLAVMYGNLAVDGCVVKTAGVDDANLVFSGRAHVVDSQDEAVDHILADQVNAGDVVVVRYEEPRGGPGMQEMLYPTSYPKSKGLGNACALLTDGRFSGGTIGLVRQGDTIEIDILNRPMNLAVSESVLSERRVEQDELGWRPAEERPRNVSAALKAYALMTTSADRGAVRDLSGLE